MIQFNFCTNPLCKENVTRINVEIEDSNQIKDAFKTAISIYNQKTENKIINETGKYKIRLSKKSGLPDNDLPGNKHINKGIADNLIIKDGNYLNFSIIIEDSHKLPITNYTSDSNTADILKPLLIENVQKKKKCCCFYLF